MFCCGFRSSSSISSGTTTVTSNQATSNSPKTAPELNFESQQPNLDSIMTVTTTANDTLLGSPMNRNSQPGGFNLIQNNNQMQIDEDEAKLIEQFQKKPKRGGVSAQPIDVNSLTRDGGWQRPIYEKTDQEKNDIRQMIKSNERLQVLFGHLESQNLDHVIDAMYRKTVQIGENVIVQGDTNGDAFYVVNKGEFSVYINRTSSNNQQNVTDSQGTKVATCGTGSGFGELALLYDSARAATVTCTSAAPSDFESTLDKNNNDINSSESAELWVLDRLPFQMLLVSAQSKKVELYEGLLRDVALFQELNRYELGMLSELLETELYEENEVIVKQNDEGACMYVLEEGECKAYIEGENGIVEVKHYKKKGEYFGEIALIKEGQRRKATVKAYGDAGCGVLVLKKKDFDRVIGPIVDTLVGLLDAYPQYREFFED